MLIDLVAQLCRSLIGLGSDGVVHFSLHLLEFGQWLFGPNFLEPVAKETEFWALERGLGLFDFFVEGSNFFSSFLNFASGGGNASAVKFDGCAGACLHHNDIGRELKH